MVRRMIMSEEELYALDKIRKAVSNEQPYTITKLISEQGEHPWALFRLESTSAYDDAIPLYDNEGERAGLYLLVINTKTKGEYRQKLKHTFVHMHPSTADAARWALNCVERVRDSIQTKMQS